MSDLSESAPVYVISKLRASPDRVEHTLADDFCKILRVVRKGESERRGDSRALDHAAIGRNRPIAENVIDSKIIERACREKPASTFSQRALERVPIAWNHAIEKDSLKIKELEHVLIGKPLRTFPGHALKLDVHFVWATNAQVPAP